MNQFTSTSLSHPSSTGTYYTTTMIPKTILLLLAMLAACSYATVPISTEKISSLQSSEDLDQDKGVNSYTLSQKAERYLKEENIEYEPDAILDAEDRVSEVFDGKISERDFEDEVCRKIRYEACKVKKFCCCRLTKKQRKKCKKKCNKKAKRKCGVKD